MVEFLVLFVGLKVAQRVAFISALLSRRKVGVRNKLELQNLGKARPFIALPDAYSDGLLHERSLSLCVILPISYGLMNLKAYLLLVRPAPPLLIRLSY